MKTRMSIQRRWLAFFAFALALAFSGAAAAHPMRYGGGPMHDGPGIHNGGMHGMHGPMHRAGMHGHMHGPMHRAGMHGRGHGGMHGPGMMGGMAYDADSAADMHDVHDMLMQHERIVRQVTNLPDGIRTVTESDDPAVAQAIRKHVASMEARLADGRVFNRFSENLPVLFAAKDKLKSHVEMTSRGAVVTQTSADPAVVRALQAHAEEVSELARDGRAAMMRAAMRRR